MNDFTFTVCRGKPMKPETLAAIGEMLKVAIENLNLTAGKSSQDRPAARQTKRSYPNVYRNDYKDKL